MRRLAIVVALLVLVSTALAQSGRGAIGGTIVTDSGDAVGSATIQAKEQSTGKLFTAVTSKTGRYRLADLPAGTYEIAVPQLGLRTSRYAKPGVPIHAWPKANGRAIRARWQPKGRALTTRFEGRRRKCCEVR